MKLTAERLTCCHWSWTFQETNQDTLLWSLVLCVYWQYEWLCIMHLWPITGCTVAPTLC